MKFKKLFIIIGIVFCAGQMAQALEISKDEIFWPALNKYKFEASKIIEVNDKKSQKFAYKSESTDIEINFLRPVSKEEFVRLKTTKFQIISQLYKQHVSPYVGMISKNVVCGSELRPKIREFKNGAILTAGSNKLGQFGICENKAISHTGIVTFYYDSKTNSQFEIHANFKKSEKTEFERIVKAMQELLEK